MNVFLETGCTNDDKPNIYNDNYEVQINNTALKQKNAQYVHNGKGTAIISNKGVVIQPTRKEYNGEKIIMAIART